MMTNVEPVAVMAQSVPPGLLESPTTRSESPLAALLELLRGQKSEATMYGMKASLADELRDLAATAARKADMLADWRGRYDIEEARELRDRADSLRAFVELLDPMIAQGDAQGRTMRRYGYSLGGAIT